MNEWIVDERVGNLWEKTCNALRSNVKERKNQRNERETERQREREREIAKDKGLYYIIR